MSVHVSVRAWKEGYTFMKLQCILVILYILHILCYIMLFGSVCISLLILVQIFQPLAKIHQNQFFIYLYGFKHLVLYNLVVCYSLDPVLVIWYVTLIIFFLQIQVYFSKLKKISFDKSKLGKTAVLVIFNVIYVNLCNCELSPSPGSNYMHS